MLDNEHFFFPILTQEEMFHHGVLSVVRESGFTP